MSQLNPSDQEATDYASAWIIKNDMTKAFDAAFPNSKSKKKSRYEVACRLHKHVKIQSRIKELQQVARNKSNDEFGLSVAELQRMLAQAAKMGLGTKIDQQGNTVPVGLSGAVSAIAEINKMDGNHAAIKNETDLTLTEPITITRTVVDP